MKLWHIIREAIQGFLNLIGGFIMGCLGNAIWFICGGFLTGLSWLIAGCLWCMTIIGIPIGIQCFKFAGLCFFPFGKEVEYGGGAGSLLMKDRKSTRLNS